MNVTKRPGFEKNQKKINCGCKRDEERPALEFESRYPELKLVS